MAKKVTRLTESDLVRLIKRVIEEQSSNQQNCFNTNYLKEIVSKNGFKTTPMACPSFSENSPEVLRKNTQIASYKKGPQQCFEISEDNKKIQASVDLFGSEPELYFAADFPEDYKIVKQVKNVAQELGLQVKGDYDNRDTFVRVLLDEPGKKLQCGNYEQFMKRLSNMIKLFNKLGSKFTQLSQMTSRG